MQIFFTTQIHVLASSCQAHCNPSAPYNPSHGSCGFALQLSTSTVARAKTCSEQHDSMVLASSRHNLRDWRSRHSSRGYKHTKHRENDTCSNLMHIPFLKSCTYVNMLPWTTGPLKRCVSVRFHYIRVFKKKHTKPKKFHHLNLAWKWEADIVHHHILCKEGPCLDISTKTMGMNKCTSPNMWAHCDASCQQSLQ